MCSLEFPDLEILDQQHDELFVLGLAGGEGLDTVNAFVEQTGVTFPIAWDEGVLRSQIAFPDSISPYPRQVVIDRDGVIVYAAAEHSDSDLAAAIEGALAR